MTMTSYTQAAERIANGNTPVATAIKKFAKGVSKMLAELPTEGDQRGFLNEAASILDSIIESGSRPAPTVSPNGQGGGVTVSWNKAEAIVNAHGDNGDDDASQDEAHLRG